MIDKIYLNISDFGRAKIKEAEKSLAKVWLYKCRVCDNNWSLYNKITNNGVIDFCAIVTKPIKPFKLGDSIEIVDIDGSIIAYCFISKDLEGYLASVDDNNSIVFRISGVDINSIDIFKVEDKTIGDFIPDVDLEQLKQQIIIDVTKIIDNKFENQSSVDLEELKSELKLYIDDNITGSKAQLTKYLTSLNSRVELLSDKINNIDNYVKKQDLEQILKELINEIDIESSIINSNYLNTKFEKIKVVEDALKLAIDDNKELITNTISSVSDNKNTLNNLEALGNKLTNKTDTLIDEVAVVKQQISEFTFLTHDDITTGINDYISNVGIEAQIEGSGYINSQFNLVNTKIVSLINRIEALEVKVETTKAPEISFEFGANDGNQLGSLHWYCFETTPNTYLSLSGGQFRIVDYQEFFNKFKDSEIIHRFDESQGIFFISDWRGDFVRMWDNGKGVDQGRSVGSWQGDLFKSHNHKYRSLDGMVFDSVYDTYAGGKSNLYHSVEYVAGMSMNSVFIAHEGGDETRPRNIALNLIIKAKQK